MNLIETISFCSSVIFHHFISGVQDFLNHEHRVFNSEEFLRTREPSDQSFYKKVHSYIQYIDIHTNTHTHRIL